MMLAKPGCVCPGKQSPSDCRCKTDIATLPRIRRPFHDRRCSTLARGFCAAAVGRATFPTSLPPRRPHAKHGWRDRYHPTARPEFFGTPCRRAPDRELGFDSVVTDDASRRRGIEPRVRWRPFPCRVSCASRSRSAASWRLPGAAVVLAASTTPAAARRSWSFVSRAAAACWAAGLRPRWPRRWRLPAVLQPVALRPAIPAVLLPPRAARREARSCRLPRRRRW